MQLSTAYDAGVSRRDAVFGQGILNRARAFQQQRRTSLAGSAEPVSLNDNGQTSGAMGDATGQMTGAIILDGYSRAYANDHAQTLARAPQDRPATQALHGPVPPAVAGTGTPTRPLTVTHQQPPPPGGDPANKHNTA